MELAFRVLHGHFGTVYLLQVSKNDDEKRASKNNLALVSKGTSFLFGVRLAAKNILISL